MSTDDSDTGSGRRPRAGESGAPVGSILSIILAVAAVLIGLFILRQIEDDDETATTPGPDPTTESTPTAPSDSTAPGGSGPQETTPTTEQIDVREGATVVIANANTTGGSAGQMNEEFRAAGFETGPPVDAAGEEVQLDRSKVYFTRGNRESRDVANTAARLLGGVEVERMPDTIPVQGGRIDGEVLVMLGIDEAGKSLEELSENPGGTDTTVLDTGASDTGSSDTGASQTVDTTASTG